jgi:prefoldin beta subunit
MAEKNKKIQEINILESNLQNLLLQKQVFQMELAETDSALSQIEKSGDEVFKIVGQLMVKSDKKTLKDELLSKKKILEIRLNSIDKQEASILERVEALKSEILKK